MQSLWVKYRITLDEWIFLLFVRHQHSDRSMRYDDEETRDSWKVERLVEGMDSYYYRKR